MNSVIFLISNKNQSHVPLLNLEMPLFFFFLFQVLANDMLTFVCYVYRIPLFGEFTCQNAVMAERFIEAGSAYVSKSILTRDCSSVNTAHCLPVDVILTTER